MKAAQLLPALVGFALFLYAHPARAADSDIVLNEVMYHPADDRNDLQYVEVYNRGSNAVDISKWAFTKGIAFTFPDNTQIKPDSYLVIAGNLQAFKTYYGRDVPVVGNFTNHLSHKSDRVELSNSQKKVIDWVKYEQGNGWPHAADGYGSSLERISTASDESGPANWAPSLLPPVSRPLGTPGKRNDSFSASLPPAISSVKFSPKNPKPGEKVTVEAVIASGDGVQEAKILHRLAMSGRQTAEKVFPMQRIAGDERKGTYQGIIDAQADATLSRFRISATGKPGTRFYPSTNEPAPAISYYTFNNTNTAKIAFGFVITGVKQDRSILARLARLPQRGGTGAEQNSGTDSFIYVPSNGEAVQVFDYVRVTPRKGGFKVRFLRDNRLKGMSVVNIIFEGSPRWILSEPLSYELYRLAGIPAELTEHVRVCYDGQWRGYQLLIEQPNRAFLERNKRDSTGNLYKLLWYENGIVGQHEKKTNPRNGHSDLIRLVEELRRTSGDAQWQVIEKNFNVPEFINYYAVNMCIENWDGFFNNYFVYHDTGKTGKWEIYPWDEDKTWGDYDGASPKYDWYEFPLTFGMNGDRSPNDFGRFGSGPFGGVSWWRAPGWFSGPLLANPTFRKKFLERLREICTTVFTEEKFLPIINAMENRLEPEFSQRPGGGAMARQFKSDMQSFRNQLTNRRKVILRDLEKEKK